MRKVLAFFVLGGVVAAGFSVSETEAYAAVSPSGTIELDCDNQTDFNTSLSAISWPGTDYVFTALIDDTITFENTGGTGACTFAVGTAFDTGTTTIAAGATTTETVANSGQFVVTPDGGAARIFYVDACSLSGSGFAADPWLVGSGEDLKKVGDESTTAGETSCSLAGSYLQTANITQVDTDTDSDFIVAGTFTGTYDGDHYTISYFSGGQSGTYESRGPLFDRLGPGGLIEKLSLTGNIKNSSTDTSSLVEELYGGTLSEIKSSVWLQVDDDSNAVIGGLAAESGGTNQNAFIRYSSFDGRIEWEENDTSKENIEGPTIGGLVGIALGTGTTEIRDSYSMAAISFDSGDLTSDRDNLTVDGPLTDPEATIYAGGILGSDGDNDLSSDDVDANGGDRVHSASEVRLVRTYFAGSFTNTCDLGSAAACNTDTADHVVTGGLYGVSEDLGDTEDLIVSSFWLSSSATNAVGEIVDGGNQPLAYTTSSDTFATAAPGVDLPEATPLSAGLLKTLTTYQSKEDATTSGAPSGDGDLALGASTDGTATEEDYRWAIESGNVLTFVPSSNAQQSDYLQRALYSDTGVAQTYRREGAGDLTAHGGEDPESVTGYPSLGRVWEICTYANNGYPVLVWEEEDCAAPGGGSTERSQAAEARSLGFTEEEYLRFLDSGLTWEQFTLQLQAEQSAALASTGLSAERMGLVAAGSLGLLLGGLVLLWVNRRRSVGRSST